MLNKLIQLQKQFKRQSLIKEFWFLNKLIKTSSEKDAKELIQINMEKLKRESPKPEDVEPREFYQNLFEQARHGPIFDFNTIDFINHFPETQLPNQNRKYYVKWLANQLMTRNIDQTYLITIKDWLNQNPTIDINTFSYESAVKAADEWHQLQFKPADESRIGKYTTKDVVYDFRNGYTMVRVPSEDLNEEGTQMGHCVGGYCDWVQSGATEIYSLRDAQNKAHVTIELSGDTMSAVMSRGQSPGKSVEQIKGKENKPPIGKYSDMIREFLAQTDWDYKDSNDFKELPISKNQALKYKNDDLTSNRTFNPKTPEIALSKNEGLEYFINEAHIEWPELLDKEVISGFLKRIERSPGKIKNILLTKSIAKHTNQDDLYNLFVKIHDMIPTESMMKARNEYLDYPAERDKKLKETGAYRYPTEFFVDNLSKEKLHQMAERYPSGFASFLTNKSAFAFSSSIDNQNIIVKAPQAVKYLASNLNRLPVTTMKDVKRAVLASFRNIMGYFDLNELKKKFGEKESGEVSELIKTLIKINGIGPEITFRNKNLSFDEYNVAAEEMFKALKGPGDFIRWLLSTHDFFNNAYDADANKAAITALYNQIIKKNWNLLEYIRTKEENAQFFLYRIEEAGLDVNKI